MQMVPGIGMAIVWLPGVVILGMGWNYGAAIGLLVLCILSERTNRLRVAPDPFISGRPGGDGREGVRPGCA